MKMKSRLLRCLVFILLLVPALPAWTAEKTDEAADPAKEEVIAPEVVEQAKEVIAELNPGQKKMLSLWLHMLDEGDDSEGSKSSVLSYGPQVPGDLARVFGSAGGEEGGAGFLGVLLRTFLALALGYLIVRVTEVFMRKNLAQFIQTVPPGTDGLSQIYVGFMRNLPNFISLLLFAIISTAIFLAVAGGIEVRGRMFFQTVIGTILIFMGTALIGRIIFSPDDEQARPIDMVASLAKPLYRAFYISFGVLLSGLLLVSFVRELGAVPQTVSWVGIVLGSAVILIYIFLIVSLRQPVADGMLAQLEQQEGGWVKKQLASFWHILALIYLMLVWFFWVGQQLTGTTGQKGTFIASMFIIPLFFVLNYLGRMVISASVEALNLGHIDDDEFEEGADEAVKEEERQNKRQKISAKVHQVFKTILFVVLLTWFVSLWGVKIPFASAALKAVFESIVTLALALIAWRFASNYITRKLEEAEPEVEDTHEDVDDEFGGAAQRGRSHTLLPLLRKVIGTVLVMMVLLIIISSLGVNIAPLLAGAGVVGLAVGFGAQKLVSDVLSGFFFLLDDAFRVGEYIQAGSIRGTVEAITLRNVMLRHHLGMLQVVPHSDLGAITNYMRGGIVIKFPLEFPYDTDIDKVRKIIKKVGIAMLEDEELADDFILPIKSQGVHEITNSVMVIRVKFTAKPGKQFMIKREAFRRITEALNAKGIYYAHRKVIVDFPDEVKGDSPEQQAKQKVLEAGAAAALAIEAEQQEQEKKSK